jgi:uncharacterized phage protein (TIGR02220 family)
MSINEPTFSLRMVKAMIKQVTGQEQTIGIPRPFIKMTGDHITALVLNQIIFFTDSFDGEDGWFFRSREQWEKDICVSPYQLKRAVDALARFGVERKIKKVNGAPTLHFRIDFAVFIPLLTAHLDNQETSLSRPIIKKLDNQETSLSDTDENPNKTPIVKKLDNQETSPSIVEKLDHPLKDQKTYSEDLDKNKKPLDSPAHAASPVRVVFEYWQEKFQHPQAKLTPERERVIRARLKDGYTVEEIKRAIDGCHSSPFHMGQNESNKIHDGLDLICRNGSKLESFMSLVSIGSKPQARAAPAPLCSLCHGKGHLTRYNPTTKQDERIECSCQRNRSTKTHMPPGMTA